MTAIKPYEENKEDFIYLKMRRQDGCAFFICMDKLEKILDKEKLTGARSIYNKMMALLAPKEEDIDAYYYGIIQELTGKVISHFAKDKAYTFKVNKRIKNEAYDKEFDYIDVDTGKGTPKTIILTYTSAEMIGQAVSSALHVFLNREDKKDKKEEVIRASYVNIINYLSKDKELSEIISHYKATVISGYIAIELGFTLSADLKPINIKEVPPTNEQIYNAVKYFTDPLNPTTKKKNPK